MVVTIGKCRSVDVRFLGDLAGRRVDVNSSRKEQLKIQAFTFQALNQHRHSGQYCTVRQGNSSKERLSIDSIRGFTRNGEISKSSSGFINK